jgi:hypothetical protein
MAPFPIYRSAMPVVSSDPILATPHHDHNIPLAFRAPSTDPAVRYRWDEC